jgi:phage terminase large subunit-like protein
VTLTAPVSRRAGLWGRVADAFGQAGAVSRWRSIARPEQVLPPLSDPWLLFLMVAGRGGGKSKAGTEGVAELMRRYPGCRVALIAPTFADARDTVVEGESGLLAALDDIELRGGSRESAWNRSLGELYMANGSRARVFSAETPSKLRGPQHHVAYADEIAVWRDAHLDPGTVDTTWSNLMLGLRLPALPGWPSDYAPRVIATTTPRRCALLRVPASVLASEPHRAGLTQWPADVARFSHWTTYDNLANLADAFRRVIVEPLQGTRLGRQELDAELLDDVQGALLQQAWIDAGRRRSDEIPPLAVRAVGIDPATTATEASDLTGIVAAGVDQEMHGYLLEDRSGRYSPEEWAGTAWQLAVDVDADVVVVEDNAGGDMVESTLKVAWLRIVEEQRARGNRMRAMPPIVRVTPSGPDQSKWQRAQTIALMYEQAPPRIHHVMPATDPRTGAAVAGRLRNPLDEFEDQATTWTGGKGEASPDRVDAGVHALRWLLFPGARRKGNERAPGPGGAAQRWQAGTRR